MLLPQVENLLACLSRWDGKIVHQKKGQAMLGRKDRMQPYQHVTAKGNNGAVTLSTKRHFEMFVVLGASCRTSVTSADGEISSFTVIPKNDDEVVAIAVVNGNPAIMTEALLLHVTPDEDGKAIVDLSCPFASSAKAVGQLLIKDNICRLKVMEGDRIRMSVPWSAESLKPSPETSEPKVLEGESFDDLCRTLAEACVPASIVMSDKNLIEP